MKKFAKLIALVLALVLVLSLAACKKGGEKSTEAASSGTPAATTPAPAGNQDESKPAPVDSEPASAEPVPAIPVDTEPAAPASDLTGEYMMESQDGVSMRDSALDYYGSEEAFIEEWGITIDEYLRSNTITLNADGTMLVKSLEGNQTGTWSANGNNITMTVDEESITGVYEDGRITVNDSGTEFVIVRIG